LKGVGRIYQQTFIDTYAKVVFAKLYDRKTPITAAEILNDRVVPFYDEHGIRLSRMLTDRGTEFCGSQSHEYELYLAVEDVDHSRTTTKSPQTNGICERFHRTVLDEFYRVAFRKKIYLAIDELQADLDLWYADLRPRRGSVDGIWRGHPVGPVRCSSRQIVQDVPGPTLSPISGLLIGVELLQQRLGVLQVLCREAFGEPAVDRRE
jgi:transposase InsO family protein